MYNQKPLSGDDFARLLEGRSRYERLKKAYPDIAAAEYNEDGTPIKRISMKDLSKSESRYLWERIKMEAPQLAEFITSEAYQLMKTMFDAEVSLCMSWLDGYKEWMEATDGKGSVIYPPNYTG